MERDIGYRYGLRVQLQTLREGDPARNDGRLQRRKL